ncbi:MAG: lytic transglycosylase domain-containing protein, partial [Ignavibacteriaceae bacterium]|nr:lytic transglycosylase domain-containing protein [Ignavibacteriaceae bacterium]
EYYEVRLDSSVADFADYAKRLNVNYFILKMYNPWLRDNYLSNKTRKAYTIKLPQEGNIEIIKE